MNGINEIDTAAKMRVLEGLILPKTDKLKIRSYKPEIIEVDIVKLINARVSYYRRHFHPRRAAMHINHGDCYEFADFLQDKIGGLRIDIDHPYHGWLYWNGRHYDSESPSGEALWTELKIFKRFKVKP